MPIVYLCRTFLSDGKEAVAHAEKDDPEFFETAKSIVRIQGKEEKNPSSEFEIEGEEIASMHYIRGSQFLAIATEGSNKVFVYNLLHNKIEKTLPFPSHIQSLTTTENSLIVGAGGSLHIYDGSLNLRKSDKIGDVVKGLTASKEFILCDVFTKADNTSQVKQFDGSGTFLRNAGLPRTNVKIKNCFLGFLGESTYFSAIPKSLTCDIHVYDSATGVQKSHLAIDSGEALFIFPLLHGGIAVCCHKKETKTVCVYDSSDFSVLLSAVSDVALRFREDMILFVAAKEKEQLPALATGIAGSLGALGLFPAGLTRIMRDYAISYQALDPETVETLLARP